MTLAVRAVDANRDWDGVAFRDELERLKERLNLTVVHVLEQPPEVWAGETGYVTAEVLSRHLPPGYRRFQFFICGPDPMMDAAEAALIELGVAPDRVTPSDSTWCERMRHVQMTRLVWLIAVLIVIACIVFAAR